MTAEQPEQCPVCGQEYDRREKQDSQAALDVPTHSRVCIQRFGTAFDVYCHEKISIELEERRPEGHPLQEPDSYEEPEGFTDAE